MKRIILGFFFFVILVACGGPSESAIQTAIAETESAKPTATPIPIDTLTPTNTPTQTPTLIPLIPSGDWFVQTTLVDDADVILVNDHIVGVVQRPNRRHTVSDRADSAYPLGDMLGIARVVLMNLFEEIPLMKYRFVPLLLPKGHHPFDPLVQYLLQLADYTVLLPYFNTHFPIYFRILMSLTCILYAKNLT